MARADTPLKLILVNEGRSQSWLARQIGARPEQVNRWVHGLHEPAVKTQAAIADALGRSVAELWPVGHGGASDHTMSESNPSRLEKAA